MADNKDRSWDVRLKGVCIVTQVNEQGLPITDVTPLMDCGVEMRPGETTEQARARIDAMQAEWLQTPEAQVQIDSAVRRLLALSETGRPTCQVRSLNENLNKNRKINNSIF